MSGNACSSIIYVKECWPSVSSFSCSRVAVYSNEQLGLDYAASNLIHNVQRIRQLLCIRNPAIMARQKLTHTKHHQSSPQPLSVSSILPSSIPGLVIVSSEIPTKYSTIFQADLDSKLDETSAVSICGPQAAAGIKP